MEPEELHKRVLLSVDASVEERSDAASGLGDLLSTERKRHTINALKDSLNEIQSRKGDHSGFVALVHSHGAVFKALESRETQNDEASLLSNFLAWTMPSDAAGEQSLRALKNRVEESHRAEGFENSGLLKSEALAKALVILRQRRGN